MNRNQAQLLKGSLTTSALALPAGAIQFSVFRLLKDEGREVRAQVRRRGEKSGCEGRRVRRVIKQEKLRAECLVDEFGRLCTSSLLVLSLASPQDRAILDQHGKHRAHGSSGGSSCSLHSAGEAKRWRSGVVVGGSSTRSRRRSRNGEVSFAGVVVGVGGGGGGGVGVGVGVGVGGGGIGVVGVGVGGGGGGGGGGVGVGGGGGGRKVEEGEEEKLGGRGGEVGGGLRKFPDTPRGHKAENAGRQFGRKEERGRTDVMLVLQGSCLAAEERRSSGILHRSGLHVDLTH
eukprot:763344-Hanusia_phi.AAC.1